MSCLWTQWRISREADGAPRRAGVSRHLARCERCRRFDHRLHALGTALRTAAVAAPPVPAARPARRPLVWASAAALGAAVAAILAWPAERATAPIQPRPGPSATSPAVEPAVAPVELERMRADARDGLGFVLRVSGLPTVGSRDRSM